jgi:serine/threonine-protein kinase
VLRSHLFAGNRLRAVSLESGAAYGSVRTVCGGAEAGCVDGRAAVVRFDSPNGLAVDASRGLVYVADNQVSGRMCVRVWPLQLTSLSPLFSCCAQNHKIRVVNVLDGSTSTLAGSGKKGFADGSAKAAAFNWPKGLALDAAKQLLYV